MNLDIENLIWENIHLKERVEQLKEELDGIKKEQGRSFTCQKSESPVTEPAGMCAEEKRSFWKWEIDYDNATMEFSNPHRVPLCCLCGEEPCRESDLKLPRYCPNCGAKMEGVI